MVTCKSCWNHLPSKDFDDLGTNLIFIYLSSYTIQTILVSNKCVQNRFVLKVCWSWQTILSAKAIIQWNYLCKLASVSNAIKCSQISADQITYKREWDEMFRVSRWWNFQMRLSLYQLSLNSLHTKCSDMYQTVDSEQWQDYSFTENSPTENSPTIFF